MYSDVVIKALQESSGMGEFLTGNDLQEATQLVHELSKADVTPMEPDRDPATTSLLLRELRPELGFLQEIMHISSDFDLTCICSSVRCKAILNDAAWLRIQLDKDLEIRPRLELASMEVAANAINLKTGQPTTWYHGT